MGNLLAKNIPSTFLQGQLGSEGFTPMPLAGNMMLSYELRNSHFSILDTN